MNEQDRQAIDGLFSKLGEAERQSGPRDAEAEGHIAQRIAAQPAAPYLMAQTIVMQNYALEQAQARISELEQQAQETQERPASGGLLGGLFGSSQPARRSGVPSMPRTGSPYGAPGAGVPAGASAAWQQGGAQQPGMAPGMAQGMQGRAGGGFLAGAAQTAMGVAGGVLLGNALMGMFGGSEANAAEAPAESAAAEPDAGDTGGEDISGADGGGWFDGGGFFGGDDEI